ncbi:MAG: ABC transporter ATP-binding protein/permease [Bacteriovoracaceae bacterium]|nr:ABC transporter ATP-binding protein/permease [Bacteriovoracaceae bacterium]
MPENPEVHDHLKEARRHWLKFLKSNWVIYSWGVFFVLSTAMLQVLVTRLLGWVLDFFTKDPLPKFFYGASEYDTFLRLFVFLVIARCVLFFSRVGWRITMARQTHVASSELKVNIWDNVRFFKSVDLVRHFTKGILMNANTSDVARGRFIYGFTLVAIFDMLFLGLFTLGTMISIHAPLTLISLCVLMILPFFVKKLSHLEMTRYRTAQETLGDFNDLTSQVVSTIRLQRITQTGEFWSKKMMASAESYRQKRLEAVFTSLRYIPTMGGGYVLSYAVLFFVGIPYVLKGDISVGDFVAMQGLIFLLQDPLAELGFIISEWKKSFTSLERLSEIYLHEQDPHLGLEGDELLDTQTVLDVESLSFKYFDGEENVIEDLSFNISAGKRLGITGPIGSGKSTLVRILSGIERQFEGDVSFMGRPFNDYSHEFLRTLIGYVPQKPFLFADTIRENIRLDRDLDDEQVWHFLEMSCLADDVRQFPEGLGTPLGEWGINLSGGQKQRLTLARALARECQLYFFDDCLSAVDTVTEERILKNLNQQLKSETLVWVAHRPSTLKYCHQILELES